MRPFATLLSFLVLAVLAAPAGAQVNVDPNLPGALNEAVNTNTTAGQVFVLQQGATYRLTDRMEPTVDVVIRADGGNCPVVESDCPLIQPLTQGGNTERIMGMEESGVSATFEGVAITNTSAAGASDERTFRLQADDVSLTLHNVLVFDEPTMVVRVDDDGGNIYIYDSVFRQIGDPAGNPDEGRVVDDRGSDIGDLVVVGNTFYSVNNRVIRNDGGDVDFFRFDNNTVHLIGRRVLETGDVDGDVYIRNNLLIDTGLEGSEDDGDGTTDDRDGQIRLGDEIDGLAVITNNSFVFDSALLPNEQPVEPKAYDEEAGDDAAEGEDFEFRPALNNPQTTFFDASGAPYDYGYPTTEATYTAATDGGPLGSRIWFDTFDNATIRETTVASFSELQGALANLQDGDIVTLTGDIMVTETIETDEDVTIRGSGDIPATLMAADGFEDRFFEPVDDLSLVNLVVDGRGQTEEFVRVQSEDAEDGSRDDQGDDDLTLRNVVLANNGGDGNDGIRFDGEAGSLRLTDVLITGVTRRPIATRGDSDLSAVSIRRSTIANSDDRVRFEGAIGEVEIRNLTLVGVQGDGLDFDSDDIDEVDIEDSILIPVEGEGNRAIDHSDSPPEFEIDYTNVFPVQDAGGEDNLDDAAETAFTSGEGNLEVNPMFADADRGDFRLPEGSPLLTANEDGEIIGDPNQWVLSMVVDREATPEAFGAPLTAFPNPAAARATVAFALDAPAEVRLDVFDVLGRRVATLAEGAFAAGEATVDFPADGLPSGVYVLRLEAGDAQQTLRVTVVR
ncbi:MAG: T9SS type A sorting domain-containing protein [Bacteroidota bacterium]